MKKAFRKLEAEWLENRWNPSWGGIPPAAIVPPTSAKAVALDTANNAYGSAAITSSEIDYYSFRAPVTGTYRLAAESGSIDTVMALYSAAGIRLAYNDDIVPFTNTDSERTVSLTAGTRYFLGISKYAGTSGGSYDWTIDGPSTVDDAYEQNDSFAAAKGLGTISNVRSIPNLVMNDSADWFRFTLGQAGGSGDAVKIAFNDSHGDLDLELYNSAGTRLAISDGTSDAESISLNGREAGTYFVHVYGYRNVTNPSYTLTIDAPAPPPAGVDLRGALVAATDFSPWGQAISVQSAVRNAGTVDAGAFQTQWWLSRDTTWSSDDIILTELNGNPERTITSLAAGATSPTITVTLALPPLSAVQGWTGTTFNIVMRIDPANAVPEAFETNNTGQAGLGRGYDSITISNSTTGGFQITLNISGMTAAQQGIFQQAAARWSQIVTGDIPNATYQGRAVDDLLIDASGQAIDGSGGVLGQSGPDAFRAGSELPIHAVMEFDTADLASMQSNGTLLAVIEHEMGHALGIGTIWDNRGLLQGAGTSNPIFTGARATAEYNRIFGTSAAGVPVENGGGSGTRDSHWRESILGTELMTGYAEAAGTPMPLSRITAASLGDIGYQVNLNAADAFTASAALQSASAPISSSSSMSSLRAVDAAIVAFTDDWQPNNSHSRGRLAR